MAFPQITYATIGTITYTEQTISDLKGYTWVANSEPTLNNSLTELELSFTSNGSSFNGFDISQNAIHYVNFPQATITAYEYSFGEGTWSNQAYKTIVISGGADTMNAMLIAWLQANGTLTAPPAPSISDLTGTKWLINDNLTVPASNYGLQINNLLFASNGASFDGLIISRRVSNPDIFVISYGADTIAYDYNNYTGQGTGWTSQAYRTIEITGGSDVTNADLIAWLEANATQVVSATPSLNFGGSDVSLFLGSSYVSKVYLGSTLLYEGEAPSVTLISFEVGNTTYQAEQGMTWAQWLASNYNINGFYSQYGYIQYSANDYVVIADGSNTAVQPTDTIIDNGEYELYIAGGGND